MGKNALLLYPSDFNKLIKTLLNEYEDEVLYGDLEPPEVWLEEMFDGILDLDKADLALLVLGRDMKVIENGKEFVKFLKEKGIFKEFENTLEGLRGYRKETEKLSPAERLLMRARRIKREEGL